MKSCRSVPPIRRWLSLTALALTGWFAGGGSMELSADDQKQAGFTAELVEFTGTVELSSASGLWTAAPVGAVLHPGDHLRTRADSRATLRLSDLSLVRLRENTLVELRAPTAAPARRNLFLRAGAAYFLNRERPTEIEFGTPLANGAIRGTEFLLQVKEGTGDTLLALFDGAVDLRTAAESLTLTPGQQVEIEPGRTPVVSAALPARILIQWVFYYPAVLVPDDLNWNAPERSRFTESLQAYATGDLLRARAALRSSPVGRRSAEPYTGGVTNAPARRDTHGLAEPRPTHLPPADAGEGPGATTYRSALDLAVGNVADAEARLAGLPASTPGASALRELIATVTTAPTNPDAAPPPVLASDWLARSYREQGHFNLPAALAAAKQAAKLAPDFGFAWARVAELEFCFGQRDATRQALARARELSPRLAPAFALEGYVALANYDPEAALDWFDQAVALDGAFGPAWLGRGLARAARRDFIAAREDLQVAAVLEPQRALFRSYLAKAFSQTGQDALAEKDFRLAKEVDPADPTSWFYSALHHEQLNRNNEAVRELEHSSLHDDNRAVFRSRWLLDQDLAMRSADLAVIYETAGLGEVGTRAAQNAVAEDYANFSAHLFQARSLAAQEDPNQFNLRLETPRESELLLANLLAPPGGGNLSRWVSQQSRLAYFTPRRFGLTSFTGYASDGDWEQDASFYGREAGFSYALDVQYRKFDGQQPNGGLEQLSVSVQTQQRLTDADSLYFSADWMHDDRGDVASYYNPDESNRQLKVIETQEPHVFAGYHHEWSPQSHTLALFAYLRDDLQLNHARPGMYFLQQSGGEIVAVKTDPFLELNLDSQFALASAELQQIWATDRHQVVVGGRFQGGTVDSDATLNRTLTGNLSTENASANLQRATAYGYYQWDPLDWLRFDAGLSYDYLRYPLSADLPPLSDAEQTASQWSPKVALTVFPWRGGQLRGAYAKSLGGLYFDNSVRLEPTQLAGFTHAFRSLIPESVVGLVPGTEFETAGVGFDQFLPSGTYFGIAAEQLSSNGERQVGALTNGSPLPVPDTVVALTETLDFQERTVAAYANQLLGRSWTLGVRGSLSQATLKTRFPTLPPGTPGLELINTDQQATLGRLEFSVQYQHPRGWFAQWFSNYYHQSNEGYVPVLPGDSFWQQSVFAGFRFPRQRAEIRLGIINLTDQDYRLNPLNLLNEPQRGRTFVASLQLNL